MLSRWKEWGGNNMNYLKVITIYLVPLVLVTCSFKKAEAFTDYDVDWPTSDGRKQTSTLVITIDGCETKFTMKNSDIERFRNDKDNLKAAVRIAIQNTETGCKR